MAGRAGRPGFALRTAGERIARQRINRGPTADFISLPRHRPPAVLPPNLRRILPLPRVDHYSTVDLFRHTLRQHVVEEEHPPLLRQLQHHVAGGDDFGGKRRVGAAFEVAVGEAQVAGAVFGGGEAGDGEGFGGSVEGLLVFELDAERDLAFGVEGPDVGLLEVLLGVQAPDPGGEVWLPQPRRPTPMTAVACSWIG